ncbi:MAG: hypothetical protein U0821_08035 [Chloroflexota bacterium]
MSSPLDRTPEMEGLSASERARLYKERAAAAGLGKAPPPAAEGAATPAPAPTPRPVPAAQPPAAPAASAPAASSAPGADPLAATTDLSGLSPAERAKIYKQRAAAAGIGRAPAADGEAPAAAPAPAAARPAAAAAAALSPQQRERLAAAAQRTAAPAAAPAASAAATSSPAADQQGRLVYVWPHLVTIEFMSAVLMMLTMIVISVVLQAPLEGHANADKTPNPSKAPWYFLNLQELLLHMHPALAGVIVPAGALALIAIIPYFDRDTRDVGKWFGTPKALKITWHTAWFTSLILALEIMFDEWIGVKPMMSALAASTHVDFFKSGLLVDIVVPLILMLGPIWLLVILLKRVAKPEGARDWMIALFTGFFVAYIVLTIFGTFFRGQGMHLYWPWDARMNRVE